LDSGLVLTVDHQATLTGFAHLRTGQRVEVTLAVTQDRVSAVRWPTCHEPEV
jgi:hypothetical protein